MTAGDVGVAKGGAGQTVAAGATADGGATTDATTPSAGLAAAFVQPDPWAALRVHTPANIAIGRAGHSLPTREILRFGLAHAQARDAVHVPLDVPALARDLSAAGWNTLIVQSSARSREEYLRRPDFGRRLDDESAGALDRWAAAAGAAPDLCIVAGDGLSAVALQTHAVPLLAALRGRLQAPQRTVAPVVIAPVVIARQARVALGDEIGRRLRARMVVVLIGERPGLSSPDSLGVYLTWAPAFGRTDAERNCISNIRREGLPYVAAAHRLAWLVDEAFRRGMTGVDLQDESLVVRVE